MLAFFRKEKITMNSKIKDAYVVLLSLALMGQIDMSCVAQTIEEAGESEDVIETYDFILTPKI